MSPAAAHRVFVVGNSLFAESVVELLGQSAVAIVVGTAANVQMALAQLYLVQPDLVIILNSGEPADGELGPLLTSHPDLPILRADLNVNNLRLIRSQRVEARVADLLAAIQSLPTRR